MQVPQKKKKNGAPIGSRNSTSGHLNEERKRILQKDTCIPKFTAALLETAKIWKQSKYPSTDKERRCSVHTHTLVSLSHKKE